MHALRDVQSLLTILCGALLILSFFGLHPVIPILSVLAGSYFALKAAWESLRDRSVDVNFLMVFAAAGAIVVGKFVEAAVLLFLFSLSATLEAYAMARTKSAIQGLIKLRPEKAILVGESGDRTVPVEELRKGDQVRVLPFEHIPADGFVSQGETSIDQSAMTGESVPVVCGRGDRVLAGTQNLDRMFVFEVSAGVGDTTLEKIVDLVQEAQENKASGERISTWFGKRYTLFVIAAFAVSLGLRLLFGQQGQEALYSALTLLVALSPCALVISTPASTLSALAWAARSGILVRGGQFTEIAGRIDTIALDKTGTLTEGKPRLIELCVCESAMQPAAGPAVCLDETACWHGETDMSAQAREVLSAAAAAEQYSTHPIAEAIVDAARTRGVDVPEAHESRAVPGFGVTAKLRSETVKVGQRRFFEQEGTGLPADFTVHVEAMQAKGMTVAVMEYRGRYAALGLRDEPRPEVRSVLDELSALGVQRQLIVTGDTDQTANAVAAEVGIAEVHAGLLPDQKTELIDRMMAEGRHVMMVGDGINDAPSLARADIGVAMGGLGSDVTLNAADVVLMQDRLERIPDLVRIGRRTNAIVRANLLFATGVIVFLTAGSQLLDLFAPEWTHLALPFAVVGHEGSTVLVILNGLRLLRGPGGGR